MSVQTVSLSVGVLWTPPFAALNSGNSSFNLSAQYNAQNVGQIDIPGATSTPTIFPIPFGTVASCKVLIVKNSMSSDIGIRYNSAGSNEFQVAPGGVVMVAMPQSPVANPVTAISVVTTAIPGATECCSFWIYGD
jgi:hypothetical protein